jgi:Ser/Thr protein kinase RdoA (MazF antagonist)
MTLGVSAVHQSLAAGWGLGEVEVTPHHRGMNSHTWLIRNGPDRYVAKAVPSEAHRRFVSGLTVGSLVQTAGIPAGEAILARNGRPFIEIDGHTLALLTFVNGSELRGEDEREQRLIGSTLARAHGALVGHGLADAGRFHWIDPEAAHLRNRDWLRPAITAALASWESLPPASLTGALLHTDPAPEAFLLDADTGVCGLIDWDSGMIGPLIYDVASAVMYVGGPHRAAALIDAYLDHRVLDRSEVARTLGRMLHLPGPSRPTTSPAASAPMI